MLRRGSFKMLMTSVRAYVTTKTKMARSSEIDKTFKDTVTALNSLQSNAATILKSQRQKLTHIENVKQLENTVLYLQSIGIDSLQLQNLSVIHVTGTKGKGSTCSLCETILRKCGYRTGLFSSPHLMSVRERIQINGLPLDEKKFIRYFWEVKQALNEFEETEVGLPHYFNFLFVMAINVFLKEKVDVAIVEVGIGGQYDSTNVLKNVAVVGITNVGIDHTNILGSTITEIAWQKAGIMKPSATAFTVPNQSADVLKVLHSRSEELQCPLFIVPPLDTLVWPNDTEKSMINLPTVHKTNVALALQLSEAWLLKRDGKPLKSLPLKEVKPSTAKTLQYWCMPGRMQILLGVVENTIFFIDGAHTPESAIECLDWFANSSKLRSKGGASRQALICNVIGSRDLKSVLSPLFSHHFEEVYFTPNIAYSNNNQGKTGECWSSRDVTNFQEKRLLELEVLWMKERPLEIAPLQNVRKVSCVAEAVNDIKAMALHSQPVQWHVLITGSLHLVGSALSVLDPNLDHVHKRPDKI